MECKQWLRCRSQRLKPLKNPNIMQQQHTKAGTDETEKEETTDDDDEEKILRSKKNDLLCLGLVSGSLRTAPLRGGMLGMRVGVVFSPDDATPVPSPFFPVLTRVQTLQPCSVQSARDHYWPTNLPPLFLPFSLSGSIFHPRLVSREPRQTMPLICLMV